jgi:hypothetical protein
VLQYLFTYITCAGDERRNRREWPVGGGLCYFRF